MNVRLLGDLVLIRRKSAEDKVGDILLAPGSVEQLQEGEILAVGPGKACRSRYGVWVRHMSVHVGETVLFSKHGHQVVKLDGEELVTLREDSIVAVRTTAFEHEGWHHTNTIAGKVMGMDEEQQHVLGMSKLGN